MDNTMKRSATYLLGVLLLLAAGSCSVQKKCKGPQPEKTGEKGGGQREKLTTRERKGGEGENEKKLGRGKGRRLERKRNKASGEGRRRERAGA